MKRANKIQLVIAFLAIATAMSASAFAQTTKTQIQRMNPWSNCDRCAGAGGAGPTASLATAPGVKSPSISGSSRVFQIASSHAWSDALWWKQLAK